MDDQRPDWLKQLGRSLTGTSDWYRKLDIKDAPVTRQELFRYFESVRGRIRSDMNFVRQPIKRYRRASSMLRLLGVVGIACGILLPAVFADGRELEPLKGFETWRVSGIEAAYIAVAVGGIALLLDQVFDFTNGWMRLFVAESKLKRVLEELEFDWALAWPGVTDQNIASEAPKLIAKLQAAALASHTVMEEQKTSWATALRDARDALRARLETDRTLY